jgi:hypothetical protein
LKETIHIEDDLELSLVERAFAAKKAKQDYLIKLKEREKEFNELESEQKKLCEGKNNLFLQFQTQN